MVVPFENTPKNPIIIKKLDSVTGEPIPDTTFLVTKVTGELVGEYKTGHNGYATAAGLELGWYIIKEIRANAGYIANAEPKIVQLKVGEPAIVEFYNKPRTGLQIRKTDAVTGLPLKGVEFSITEIDGKKLGSFTTDVDGLVNLPDQEEKWVVVTEIRTVEGYKLDPTPRNVKLESGKLAIVEYKNQPYPHLAIQKIDADTKQPLEGVKFKLFDKLGREIGTYTTNEQGQIHLTGMDAGEYSLQESETKPGYFLDPTIKKVSLQWGKSAEIVLTNHLALGRIQIVKKAADDNPITRDKAGKLLPDAVFEIRDKELNVVDTITTDKNGVATSKDLPLGTYAVRETEAPAAYITDGAVFYAEVKKNDDLVRFEVLNTSKDISVTVEKRGNEEVIAGDDMSYDFSNIANTSNTELDEFT